MTIWRVCDNIVNSLVGFLFLLTVYLDFLDEPFGKAQFGVRVRFRSNGAHAARPVWKDIQVVVHFRVMFRQSGFPVLVEPIPFDKLVVLF